jgi:CRP-like cAMP-binding protein
VGGVRDAADGGERTIGRQGFGGLLTDDQWARLVKAGRARTFYENDVFIRQGDRENCVFLLVSGVVKVTMVRADGTGLLLAVRGPGESLGEMSALSGLAHTATITAASGSCLTSVLTCMQFRLLVRSMELERVLWEHLVQRQSESDSLRAEMASLPARQRLAATLLRLAQLMGTDVVPVRAAHRRSVVVRFGLSQRELGDSIGMSRAAVTAEFKRLRALDVIRTGREYVAIQDLDRLRRMAEETADAD